MIKRYIQIICNTKQNTKHNLDVNAHIHDRKAQTNIRKTEHNQIQRVNVHREIAPNYDAKYGIGEDDKKHKIPSGKKTSGEPIEVQGVHVHPEYYAVKELSKN